jgi:uncharacterized membrane protein
MTGSDTGETVMATFHVYAPPDGTLNFPAVRRITFADLGHCLRAGLDDFLYKPSHYVFLVLIYPVVGIILMTWTSGANALPLLYPLASGFALVGPFAAIPLYEISRRREQGLEPGLRDALEVRHSPALLSIAAMGMFLVGVFVAWLLVAQLLYTILMGPNPPTAIGPFLTEIFGTTNGWLLIVLGNGIGLVFAVIVLATTVVAFPMLLDRDPGVYAAMHTSARAVAANPVVMAGWGVIVAALLVIGMIPVFAGLIVVLPILGHATWHLYRKVVADTTELSSN